MNSTSVKGVLINISLFLLEGNVILSMTPKAGCEGGGSIGKSQVRHSRLPESTDILKTLWIKTEHIVNNKKLPEQSYLGFIWDQEIRVA